MATRMDSSTSAPNAVSPSFSKLQKFPPRPSAFPLRLSWMGCGGNRSFGHKEWIPPLPSPSTPSPRHFPNRKNSPSPIHFPLTAFLDGGVGETVLWPQRTVSPTFVSHFRLPLPSPTFRLPPPTSPFCVFCACVVYCSGGGEKDANCTCYRRLPGNRRGHRA